MKSILTLLFCSIIAFSVAAQSLEGLAGEELATAVREQYRPSLDVSNISPEIATWFDDGLTNVWLAPQSWWGSETPTDYYNIVGGSMAFTEARSDYPPGELTRIASQGNGWGVGIGVIASQETNFWSPSNDRRGDLARRMMYMATLYPTKLWSGRAIMIFCDGSWPLLQGYGKRILLDWHRADPVDERELTECRAIAKSQGNENPFVTMPELAEYLWGIHVGEAYISTENRDRTPIKAIYSIASDQYVDFYSPYIDENSQWEVDGQTIDDNCIETEVLGVGVHELSFKNSNASGSIKITITP